MNSSESKVKSKLVLAENLNFNNDKLQKLELFVNEVLSYNKKYNLISKKSEKDIWHRHCLLYTSPSPRDATLSRMPSSA